LHHENKKHVPCQFGRPVRIPSQITSPTGKIKANRAAEEREVLAPWRSDEPKRIKKRHSDFYLSNAPLNLLPISALTSADFAGGTSDNLIR
jgi:hypothetical protein